MLLAIREKVTGVIALVFVGAIALFMVVPMLYQYVAGFGSNNAIEVNGDKVALPSFNAQLAANRQRLAQAFGGQIPEYFNQDQFLLKQTVDGVIQDKLLDQATLDDGYRISKADVKGLITEIPEFQKDDVFDRETYQRELQSRGYSEALFEIDFSRQYLHGQLQEGTVKSAFVDDAQLQQVAALQHQSRDFDYVALNTEAFSKKQTVAEVELADYHAENTAQFQHPEKVSVEYVSLNIESYKKDIKLDEQEVKAEYEAGIASGRYTTAELRKARHILLSVDQEAEESVVEEKRLEAIALVERLKAGEDFAALATELSADPGSAAQGGDLGEIQRGAMVPAFEEAVYAQALNEVGEPVKTRFGFHIIRVDNIQAASDKTFSEVEQSIKDELTTNQARTKYDDDLASLSNLSFENPDSLQPVAEELALTIQTTDLFTRGSGSGIAAEAVVREAAFNADALVEGNNSTAIDLPSGEVVVVRVKQHEEARDKSLQEAKAEIETILLNQKTQTALNDAAADLQAALEEGGEIKQLAEKYSGELQTATGITRSDRKDVDNQLVDAVFKLSKPAAEKHEIGVATTANGRAVIALKSVTVGDFTALDKAEQDRLREQLLGSLGNGDYQSMLQGLRADADVVVNPQLSSTDAQ